MRFGILASAVLGLGVAQPAHAITWLIQGTAYGTEQVAEDCGGINSGHTCLFDRPWSINFNFDTLSFYVGENGGVYSLTVGPGLNAGFFQVSFREVGEGLWQGINLTYNQFSAGCSGNVSVGSICGHQASTQNFVVRQIDPPPVPEPATWAMMLLGFGAIGAAMRRRQNVRYRIARTG